MAGGTAPVASFTMTMAERVRCTMTTWCRRGLSPGGAGPEDRRPAPTCGSAPSGHRTDDEGLATDEDHLIRAPAVSADPPKQASLAAGSRETIVARSAGGLTQPLGGGPDALGAAEWAAGAVLALGAAGLAARSVGLLRLVGARLALDWHAATSTAAARTIPIGCNMNSPLRFGVGRGQHLGKLAGICCPPED